MTASATTTPTADSTESVATLPRSRFEAQQLRLKLLNDGWRTLETSTDPRNVAMSAGQVGQQITIAYFPEFKSYGIASTSALFRRGAHQAEGAGYTETYRVMQAVSGAASWVPAPAN